VHPDLQNESAHRAYQRIDALLRAYGIRNAAVRGEIALGILQESISATTQSSALEALGASVVLNKLDKAILQLQPDRENAEDRGSQKKLYLAIQHTRLPQRRPDLLLGYAQAEPDELQRLENALLLRKSPSLRRQSMGAPTLRFEGIEEVTSTTTAFFERWPLLRTSAKLFGVSLMIVLVYQFAK
jgi:hypothetical protein